MARNRIRGGVKGLCQARARLGADSVGLSTVNAGGKGRWEMFKSKAPEKEKDAATNVAEVVAKTVQQQHSVVEQPPARREPTKAGTASCIGSGMSIVGNVECNGPAQVF